MSEPFLGEVRMMSFGFAPRGWALCNGQLFPINQNQALFSLLGTTFGGDGRTTFALPDLRSRTPIHFGAGFALGQRAGTETHTLGQGEMPAHTHVVRASSETPNRDTPVGNYWAASEENNYASGAPNATLVAGSTGVAGGSQPHTNLQPYLTISFCIAIQGIYPSQT